MALPFSRLMFKGPGGVFRTTPSLRSQEPFKLSQRHFHIYNMLRNFQKSVYDVIINSLFVRFGGYSLVKMTRKRKANGEILQSTWKEMCCSPDFKMVATYFHREKGLLFYFIPFHSMQLKRLSIIFRSYAHGYQL